MLVKSVHRLPSEALSKKNQKTLLGFGKAVCAQTVGTGKAARRLGRCQKVPRKKRRGWDAPNPAFCLLKRSGLAHPIHGHLLRLEVRGAQPLRGGAAAGSVGYGNGASGQPCIIGMGKFQLSCCTHLLCVPVAPLQDRVLLQRCLPLLHESRFGR